MKKKTIVVGFIGAEFIVAIFEHMGWREVDRVASGGMMSDNHLMITFEGESEKYDDSLYAQEERGDMIYYYCIQYPDGYYSKTFDGFLSALHKKKTIVVRSLNPLPPLTPKL